MSDVCEACGTRPAPELPPIAGLPSLGRNCPRCGTFYLVGTAVGVLANLITARSLDRSGLSYLLRRRYDAQTKPLVLSAEELVALVGNTDLPKPQEQADNLILWIGRHQGTPEKWTSVTERHLAAVIGVAGNPGTSDEPGWAWLHSQIASEKLYAARAAQNGGEVEFRLTMAGWERFDELSRRVVVSRNAFMAMKFDDANLAHVLRECFKPAVARAGFTLRPLNEGQPAGLIDNQIRAAIRSARFVVADLTHDNNGAYFEAGFAEGIGVPVIYTCEAEKFEKKKTHFDTNHMKTIPWQMDQLEKAGADLTATVRETLPGEAKLND